MAATIVIEQNTVNNVILMLTDNTTISSPIFVFEFINDFNLSSKIFNSADLSNFICSYNRFEIEEVPLIDEDLLNGKVNLKTTGFWTYNIYQSVIPTLDLTGLKKISTGKAYIK